VLITQIDNRCKASSASICFLLDAIHFPLKEFSLIKFSNQHNKETIKQKSFAYHIGHSHEQTQQTIKTTLTISTYQQLKQIQFNICIYIYIVVYIYIYIS